MPPKRDYSVILSEEIEDTSSDEITDDESGYESISTISIDDEKLSLDNTINDNQTDVSYSLQTEPFIRGHNRVEDEILSMDSSAYDIYHEFSLDWPCLSFDYVTNASNNEVYIVSGTQTDNNNKHDNGLYITKLTDLIYVSINEGDNMVDSNTKVTMTNYKFKNDCSYNKVKACKLANRFIGALCDDGTIKIYDIPDYDVYLEQKNIGQTEKIQIPIIFQDNLPREGFAFDWCKHDASFAAACRNGLAIFYGMIPGGWEATRKFENMSTGIESISFNYENKNLLAIGAMDSSIYIWDIRQNDYINKLENQHAGDINVVKFRPYENTNHLISGGDDGKIQLLDLSMPTLPLVKYSYHKDPICALEWCPHDNSTFLAGSYDDRVTIWDISVEIDGKDSIIDGVPAQLMFEHYGTKNLSYAKFHPTIPYLVGSTGINGINLWRSETLLSSLDTI